MSTEPTLKLAWKLMFIAENGAPEFPAWGDFVTLTCPDGKLYPAAVEAAARMLAAQVAEGVLIVTGMSDTEMIEDRAFSKDYRVGVKIERRGG